MILFARHKTSSSFAPQKCVNEAFFRGAKGDTKKITAFERTQGKSMDLKGKQIVIAGGSGFLGISMATEFSQAGAKVTILARSKHTVAGNWTHKSWDGCCIGEWISSIDGADAIVNLAGRTVNCIKTPDHQDEILRSRIESTRVGIKGFMCPS